MERLFYKGVAGAKRKRRGLTLVESAMVLALLGLVIAGALLLYQNASTNNKVSSASSEMAAVAQAVRSVYAGQPGYGTGTLTPQLVNSLPTRMVQGTTLRHSFNNNLLVVGADSSFTITMEGLPQEGCVALATKDFGRAIQSVQVGGGAVVQGRPLTPVQAQAQCTGNNMQIAWTLY